jgi:streptogramin lyase
MRKHFIIRPIWVFLFILLPLFPVPHADAEPGDSLGIWGAPQFNFNSPQAVAVDADGNVYVADTFSNRILKFNSNGQEDTLFSTRTASFNFPCGIAVGADGYVYVADFMNYRIVKLTNDGAYKTEWRSCGVNRPMFPFAVAVDLDGNVYVTDGTNNSIQKFPKTGGCNLQWGPGLGELNGPQGIAVDAHGNVYVGDTWNAGIKVYEPSGAFLGGWSIPGLMGENSGQPQGIAVDPEGNVFVAELTKNMIQVYEMTGSATWGPKPDGEWYGPVGQPFNNPFGVALNQCGTRVYFADVYNNRIQILEGFGTAGGDLTVEAGPDQTIHLGCSSENVTLTATADPSEGVSYLWSPGGENTQSITVTPTDTTTYTVTAIGGCGKTAQDTVTVEVVPQTLPTISCPGNIVEPTEPGKSTAVVSYAVTPNDFCPGVTVVSSPPSGSEFPKGMTPVTARATDLSGNTASCSFNVTVVDNERPKIISVSANPSVLWPPNHKMVPVTVTATASDNCSTSTCNIISVTSNEPINGLGDGDTDPDWEITGNLTVNLRAERSGKGNGRFYTINLKCVDAAGNLSEPASVIVSVPKNQKK